MKDVDLYLKVRHAVRIEGLSERAAARRFGIDPRTVNKMMKFSVPPGYVRKKPPAKPKLDPFIPLIDRILAEDKSRPKKQQHTAKRIFERLRDEHSFTGGITIPRAKNDCRPRDIGTGRVASCGGKTLHPRRIIFPCCRAISGLSLRTPSGSDGSSHLLVLQQPDVQVSLGRPCGAGDVAQPSRSKVQG